MPKLPEKNAQEEFQTPPKQLSLYQIEGVQKRRISKPSSKGLLSNPLTRFTALLLGFWILTSVISLFRKPEQPYSISNEKSPSIEYLLPSGIVQYEAANLHMEKSTQMIDVYTKDMKRLGELATGYPLKDDNNRLSGYRIETTLFDQQGKPVGIISRNEVYYKNGQKIGELKIEGGLEKIVDDTSQKTRTVNNNLVYVIINNDPITKEPYITGIIQNFSASENLFK